MPQQTDERPDDVQMHDVPIDDVQSGLAQIGVAQTGVVQTPAGQRRDLRAAGDQWREYGDTSDAIADELSRRRGQLRSQLGSVHETGPEAEAEHAELAGRLNDVDSALTDELCMRDHEHFTADAAYSRAEANAVCSTEPSKTPMTQTQAQTQTQTQTSRAPLAAKGQQATKSTQARPVTEATRARAGRHPQGKPTPVKTKAVQSSRAR